MLFGVWIVLLIFYRDFEMGLIMDVFVVMVVLMRVCMFVGCEMMSDSVKLWKFVVVVFVVWNWRWLLRLIVFV